MESQYNVESTIATAQNTEKINVVRGYFTKNYAEKLPNLRDGLALSYAAANKGNNKAATRAREAAYMEKDEPLLKDTGMKLFSAELPKAESIQKTPEKKTEFSKLIANPNEKPKMTNLLLKTNESPNLTDGLEKMSTRVIPEGTHGIRFKAEMQNLTKQDENKKNLVSVDNGRPPRSFYEMEMIKKYKKNKHYLHAAPVYPTSYYGSMDATNDLTIGEYSKDNLLKIGDISEKDLSKNEETHINNWKNLAKLTSVGEMQSVNLDLVDHFIEGTGSDYSSKTLTKAVSNHSSTKKYMRDFSKVFDNQLQLHNGDIAAFADSEDFHKGLTNNGVLLSTYNYSGLDDAIGGLEFAVHGWTESEVDVCYLNIEPDGSYSGTLRFTFKDNFGLK